MIKSAEIDDLNQALTKESDTAAMISGAPALSRNDLFLLVACAIIATVLSSSPSPLNRHPSMTIASLIPGAAMDDAARDPALLQQSVFHQ